MNQNENDNYKNFILGKILFCGIFLLIGSIFLIVAVVNYKSVTAKEEKCTLSIEGYVENINEEVTTDSEGDTSVSFYPEFRYEVDNMTYTKQYSYGSNSSKYSIGQKVNILVDPNNYETYIVEGDITPKLFSFIFGGIGGIVFIVGFVFLFALRYKSQEEMNEATDAFIAENTISRDELYSRLKDDEDSPFVK